jgi:hypothetical protein
MAYSLELNVEGNILCVRASGIRTLEVVSAIIVDIFTACTEQGCTQALVDVRDLEGRLTTSDAYELVKDDFNRFRKKGLTRAAIIDRHINLEGYPFLETVARNRGFNVRMFEDIDLARQWLRDQVV